MNIFKNYIILLDINGVLNSMEKIDDREIVYHTWGSWQVSRKNLAFLMYLSDFNVAWISTWGKEANQLNRFLGIRNFKVFSDKQEAVDKMIKRGKKVLVIDDEFFDSRAYCVSPNSKTGLTSFDRKLVKGWIESNVLRSDRRKEVIDK